MADSPVYAICCVFFILPTTKHLRRVDYYVSICILFYFARSPWLEGVNRIPIILGDQEEQYFLQLI
jgi:hypothetical protein